MVQLNPKPMTKKKMVSRCEALASSPLWLLRDVFELSEEQIDLQ